MILKVTFLILLSYICKGESSQRIVNGKDSFNGQYPYMVSVRYYNMHECGGSLISSNWVLTAAHCIYPDHVSALTVLLGSVFLQNGEEANTIPVNRAVSNQDYQPYGGYFNDIGLLELKYPAKFSSTIKPVSLPKSGEITPDGAMAELTGWGYAMDNGDVFNILQNVQINVYSDEDCVKAHNGKTNPLFHICAGVEEGGKGQCTGDSGGPLTVNGVQYGIVSWSEKPCTARGFPGVFTRVSAYIYWIANQTGLTF